MFDNKQPISKIDLGWQKADFVSPVVCAENDDMDKDPSALQFAWFKVDSNIKPSEEEEQERVAAMKVQFENKIINKYGIPYGMPKSKELKAVIEAHEKKAKKSSKWDRQRQRLIDRQIEKDMKAERQKEIREKSLFNSLRTDTSMIDSLTNNLSELTTSTIKNTNNNQ
jgi:thiamine pyrophosphate-dependent acetolactate synthase large subunit-like protein